MRDAPEFPRTFKIVTIWLLLGTLIFIGFKVLEQRRERTSFVDAAGVIEIRRSADGHYRWPGDVNGVEVVFLIDTGATITALPEDLAAQAGLILEGSHGISTANGRAVGRLSRADISLRGAVQARRLRVSVAPGLETPLLGMDVLGRLQWSVANGVMRVQPLR